MTIYSGFSHWKWWFSIVMLVYQRVHPKKPNRFLQVQKPNSSKHTKSANIITVSTHTQIRLLEVTSEVQMGKFENYGKPKITWSLMCTIRITIGGKIPCFRQPQHKKNLSKKHEKSHDISHHISPYIPWHIHHWSPALADPPESWWWSWCFWQVNWALRQGRPGARPESLQGLGWSGLGR